MMIKEGRENKVYYENDLTNLTMRELYDIDVNILSSNTSDLTFIIPRIV